MTDTRRTDRRTPYYGISRAGCSRAEKCFDVNKSWRTTHRPTEHWGLFSRPNIQLVSVTAKLAPHRIAGCCHEANLLAWSVISIALSIHSESGCVVITAKLQYKRGSKHRRLQATRRSAAVVAKWQIAGIDHCVLYRRLRQASQLSQWHEDKMLPCLLLYNVTLPCSVALPVDGWAVTFGTATATVPTSYYSMWHYYYLCTLKG